MNPFSKQRQLSDAFQAVFSPGGELSHQAKIVMKELHTFAFMDRAGFFTKTIDPREVIGMQRMYNLIVKLTDYDPHKLDQLIRDMEEDEDE